MQTIVFLRKVLRGLKGDGTLGKQGLSPQLVLAPYSGIPPRRI